MKMTRGDTHPFSFTRRDMDGEIISTIPEYLTFTVKVSWKDKNALFRKTLADMTKDEENVWHVVIEPEDTEHLPYGSYVYDIEVVTTEYVQTIAKGDLQITEESTWPMNR